MSGPRPVVLLPPSEGKVAGGEGPRWDPAAGAFGRRLARPRRAVARALAAAVRDPDFDAAGAFGVKGESLLRARVAARTVLRSPTAPALQRFTGVLYDALAAPTLPPGAGDDLVIVSALAGLLTGGDPVPDHKLPMGTSLPGLGGLAAHWRPHVSSLLDEHLDGAVVWDLLPGAYAAAWRPGGTWQRRWVVKVVSEAADGRRTTVSHDNKHTKGSLARAVLQGGLTSPAGLASWADGHGVAVEVEAVEEDTVVVVRRAQR